MKTNGVYQYTFSQLLKHVKESRNRLSENYTMFKSGSAPIINLGDSDFGLYQMIVESNTVAVKRAIVDMIKHLIELFTEQDKEFAARFEGCEFYDHDLFDMMLLDGNKKVAYYFKRDVVVDCDVENYTEKGYDAVVIVHMNHYNEYGYKCCISDLNKNIENTDVKIKHITLKELYVDLFGSEEYKLFARNVNDFNKAASILIGYNTIIAPTDENIEKFKKRKSNELRIYDYRSKMPKAIYKSQFRIMKQNYITRELYRAMTGKGIFADSFVGAEWNYEIYKISDSLEQTGIIAGYLKSVEQLIYEIAKLYAGQGKTIKKKGECDYIELTLDAEEDIDYTLGSLENFLSYNTGMFDVSDYVKQYIVETVKDWRKKQRNGYFHKHNLKNKDKVKEIREKAILLYFLLLGGCKIKDNEKEKLGIEDKPYSNQCFKNESEILEDISKWIGEIFSFGISHTDEALVFNLYDDEAGWALQLTTFKNQNELLTDSFVKESFSSGKNLFRWNSSLDERKAQDYIVDLLKKYVKSEKVHERTKKFHVISVWSRYGIKTVWEQ